jgi:hypothetical protein
MVNIIEQYYRGITQQLKAEVNFINTLFRHQGVKGEGNEEILRDLLRRFIPKKYGIGTGIVIDRQGNQSRQMDIIIYDTYLYPSLLSIATVHMFPVDIVYATIEVKTTLNSKSVSEAKANIASVKDLNIVEDDFLISETRGDSLKFVNYAPRHPLGIVFAYNSDALQFETFKNWFMPFNLSETSKSPVLVGCLDQGLVMFTDIYPQNGMQPEGWLITLIEKSADGSNTPIVPGQSVEFYSHEGIIYPVKKVGENYVVIDQSRILLLFVLILSEMLSYRKINPGISFLNKYLTNDIIFHYTI